MYSRIPISMFLSACLGLGFTIGGTVDAEPPGESSVEQCHDDECDAHEVDQSAPELILGDDGNPGGSDGDPRGGDNDRGGIEVEADADGALASEPPTDATAEIPLHSQSAALEMRVDDVLDSGIIMSEAMITPAEIWRRELPNDAIRESSPLLIDLNGDGVEDVVIGTMSGRVYALSGIDGSTLWVGSALAGGAQISSSAAAYINSAGVPEVYIGSGYGDPWHAGAAPGALLGFNGRNGSRLPGFPLRLPDSVIANKSPSVFSTPAIGDINRDGIPEIVFGSLATYSIWAVQPGGSVLPGFPYYNRDSVHSSPALVDLDGNGRTDIVIGTDQTPDITMNRSGVPETGHCGSIRFLNGFGQPVRSAFYRDEIIRGSISIGDVTGDGAPNIVVGSGNHWSSNFGSYNTASSRSLCPSSRTHSGQVLVLSRNGAVARVINAGGAAMGSAALADLNGDGVADMVVGTSFQGGVGGGYLIAYDVKNGSELWRVPANGAAVEDIIGSPVAADLQGDGYQDVVLSIGSGTYLYDGRTGAVIGVLNGGAAQIAGQNSPAIADMDKNGRLDIVVAGTRVDGTTGVVQRFELPSTDASAGPLSWPMFKHDARRTANLAPPPVVQDYDARARSLVTKLYVDILERSGSSPVDQSGLRSWTTFIASGRPQSDLVATLTRSDEYIGLRVDKAYRSVLGRGPDAPGRAYWIARVKSGQVPTDEVTFGFYNSVEFYDQSQVPGRYSGATPNAKYIQHLYSRMLGRSASTAEVAFWVGMLNQHGREFVTNEIFYSTEAIRIRVAGYYRSLLGREPDAVGLANWANLIASDYMWGEHRVRLGFAGAPEYWNRALAQYPFRP